ncbi:hypothetical protein HZ326_21114 [Fusarium oxysporum f. sp. albedinis]|nr:hypothetical protein HZ326_21114 [Fusarium oxysporum f. sp. albedinis]
MRVLLGLTVRILKGRGIPGFSNSYEIQQDILVRGIGAGPNCTVRSEEENGPGDVVNSSGVKAVNISGQMSRPKFDLGKEAQTSGAS